MCQIGITQWFLNCPQGPESLKFASKLKFGYIHINAGESSDVWYLGKPEVEKVYLEAMEKFEVVITAVALNLIEKQGLLVSSQFELAKSLQKVIRDVIEAAERLNINRVYFPSFNRSQINNLVDFNKTCSILQYACDVAGSSELLIATENTLPPKENVMLIQKVNRPNLRILLDTLNPIRWGHSVIEFIDTLFPYIADQIHVKDGINGKLGNARLGCGDADLRKTLEHLYKMGFKGDFILENDYTKNGEYLAKVDKQILSSILHELSSQEKYVPH